MTAIVVPGGGGEEPSVVVIAEATGSSDVITFAAPSQPEVVVVDYAGGPKGDPAPAVELRAGARAIEWRIGDEAWEELVSYEDLASTGASPTIVPGSVTALHWRSPPTATVVQTGPGVFRVDFGIPAGKPGQPRFSGEGPPDPTAYPDAEDGDVYLDATTAQLYVFHPDQTTP